MPQMIQSLRNQKNELGRQARHLLNEKGARSWSRADQQRFDSIADSLERVSRLIDAVVDHDVDAAASRAPSRISQLHERWIRRGEQGLSDADRREIRATMSTTTPSEGGYATAQETAAQWVDRIKGFGAIRSVAGHVISDTSGALILPTSDGVSEEGEMMPENGSTTDADAVFGGVSLKAHRFSSKTITVSMELLQDAAFDISAFVETRLRNRIGRLQNRKFTTGSGNSEPTGLVTAAPVGKTGAAGQVATVIYDDLVDMVESVDAGYEDEGPLSWQFSQDMRKIIRKLKDNDGRPLWTPSIESGRQAGEPELLLGYPLVINNHMPTPGASAKSITFGQHKRYVVHDRLALTLFRMDDSAYMRKGQVGFLAYARAGGNLVDLAAVKAYQHPAA